MTPRPIIGALVILALGCAKKTPTPDSATARADSPRSTPDAIDSALRASGATRGASATAAASGPATTGAGKRRAGSDSASPPSDAADTVRGIAAVVGSARDAHVIVKPATARSTTIIGVHAPSIGAMSGTDVWVSGTRDAMGRLLARSFVVRSVDGAPALDGTLLADGDRLLIVTGDGERHAIGNPPGPLRDHVGGRVWITGPLDTGPIVFGVIEERR